MPELRHLRVFVAVAEERSFTRAAERLHLAQQAVSRSVAQLEGELGVPLLERTTREVHLTAAGASLLHSGRAVLRSADDAFTRAQTVGRGLAGIVHVGVTPPIDLGERHQVATVLRDGAPDLSVSFHELRPSEIEDRLRDRSVDLVLARTHRASAAVESAALRPTPVELVAAPGHRLAVDRPVHLHELDGERLVIWSRPGTPYTDLMLSHLQAAGATVQPVESRVTGAGGFPELDPDGAVAILPVGAFTGSGVKRVPIADEMTLPLLVLWPAGLPHAAVTRLREGLTEPPS